jgi:acyl-CoA dehydrogenase
MATTDRSWLGWPFFEERHRKIAAAIDAWAQKASATRTATSTPPAARS